MRLCVLSSGSGGNTLWVEAGSTRVLVDAGLSHREARRRCARAGIDLRDVSDVLLTHEHADHCHGASAIARKLGARVHATAGTLRALRDPPPEELRFALPAAGPSDEGDLLLGALRVRAVPVPHDASEPVVFVFEERLADGRSVRAALVTDLGSTTRKLASALQGLDALVLEMNHDVRLLLEGPYPVSLKRRVRGDFGHLSNAQGARLLEQAHHPGLRHVVLAHLSEQNNTPAHARREAEAVLERRGSRASLHVASQVRPSEVFEIAAGAHRRRPQQLALFA
jgi:phosphoribosyl 1,2-cyclic phosphodiesterase